MDQFTTHIKSKRGWLEFDIRELYQYRDLIFLFVKRNYSTRYKQTILGPLWLIMNPLITVSLYAMVFGKIADLSTDGVPQFVFYLCSNAIWTYFATCISSTAGTFTANAGIMGKVYFPRLVMPISSVLTGLLDMAIQVAMLFIIMIGYVLGGENFNINFSIVLSLVITLQVALLGLGCGIIVAALTTKYRDLVILVSFGIQLWMYASPVVYTIDSIPDNYYKLYMLNPMAPIINTWRKVILGAGEYDFYFWGISWIVTFGILFFGIVLFNRVEKTFMDTV